MNLLPTTSLLLLGAIGFVVACTSVGAEADDRPAPSSGDDDVVQHQSDDRSEQLDVDRLMIRQSDTGILLTLSAGIDAP